MPVRILLRAFYSGQVSIKRLGYFQHSRKIRPRDRPTQVQRIVERASRTRKGSDKKTRSRLRHRVIENRAGWISFSKPQGASV